MSASPGDRAKVLDNYEGFLFPVFQKILTEPDADTFGSLSPCFLLSPNFNCLIAPFVFQLMSLLIETRGALSAEHPTLQTRAGTLKPVYRVCLPHFPFPPFTFNNFSSFIAFFSNFSNFCIV